MDMPIIQYLAVILAILATGAILGVTAYEIRRRLGLYRPVAPASSLSSSLSSSHSSTHVSADAHASSSSPASRAACAPGEASTRRLIGNEAFERMRSRIASLLRLHKSDRSASLWLAGCPGDPTGWEALHSLLPGMPVSLKDVSHDGIAAVAVYSGRVRVGTLLLDEAERALRVSGSAQVTGAYVAEQNSYGPCEDMSLKIVLFYRDSASPEAVDAPLSRPGETQEPKMSAPAEESRICEGPVSAEEAERDALLLALSSDYKYVHRGEVPVLIYQN